MIGDLISIIVPVYKVEDYLNRCVDSILRQTYSNLEIILVDDGSPDDCPRICDEYAKKDERIKVIHKTNGGLSSARNAGLKISTGKYISFIDSDDWIDVMFIERLYKILVDNNTQLSACVFNKTKEFNYDRKLFIEDVEIIKENKYKDVFVSGSYEGYVCNKLFIGEIIANNQICFNENIFNSEDFIFVLDYLKFVESIAFIKQDLYFYYMRAESILHTNVTEKALTAFNAREYSIQFAKENCNDLVDLCKSLYLSILIRDRYKVMISKDYKYIQIIDEKLKKTRKGLLLFNGITLKYKLKLFLMIYFKHIGCFLYKKHLARG